MTDTTIDTDETGTRLSPRARRWSWILGLGGLILIAALCVWLARSSSASGGPGGGGGGGGPGGGFGGGRGGGQATTVGTAKAVAADLPVTLDALGTVTPIATAIVSPQVSGTITEVRFREGQLVRKGDVLVVIEPRPYAAALQQAQGALVRDRAQLANAKLLLSRYDTLLSQDSVARQDRDTQAALVGQLAGTIEVDRGAVEAARVNLEFTRVKAPVTGRVGLRVADVGNYVGAGSTTGVAVVTTLQPIDVAFTVPQQQQPAIQQTIGRGGSIPVTILDQQRTRTLDTGTFSTLDNRVDTTTGTIKGKARVANTAFGLYPAQFVNARLTVDTVRNAVTVPPSAVRQGQDGSFVWLFRPDRTVTERKVTVGVNAPDKVQILKGLALGDTIVTEGGDRLTEGATVRLPGDKVQPPGKGRKRGQGRRHRQAN